MVFHYIIYHSQFNSRIKKKSMVYVNQNLCIISKKTHKFVGLKRLKLNKWKIAIKKASGYILSSFRFDNIPITNFSISFNLDCKKITIAINNNSVRAWGSNSIREKEHLFSPLLLKHILCPCVSFATEWLLMFRQVYCFKHLDRD